MSVIQCLAITTYLLHYFHAYLITSSLGAYLIMFYLLDPSITMLLHYLEINFIRAFCSLPGWYTYVTNVDKGKENVDDVGPSH